MELCGTTISNLSLESIRGLPLPIPPLTEQRKIAEFLWEKTIEYRKLRDAAEGAIGLLREHRSALITAAVTGQIEVAANIAAEAAA